MSKKYLLFDPIQGKVVAEQYFTEVQLMYVNYGIRASGGNTFWQPS